MQRRQFVAALAGSLGAASLMAPCAHAQTVRRIVIGFPPGGSLDYVARLLAQHMPSVDGSRWIVESRAGAGGRIAAASLKKAPGDGTALLLTPSASIVQFPHLYKNLPYDPLVDLLPVYRICRFGSVLVAGPSVPVSVKDFNDLVAWLRTNPTKASYGTPATGSPPHLVGIQIGNAIGVNMTHVAYKGAAEINNDLVGGQLPLGIQPTRDVHSMIESGRLRALAVTSTGRSSLLPTVPTFRELGYAGLDYDTWIGGFLPASASGATVSATATGIAEALKAREVVEGLRLNGYEPAGESGDAFAQLIRRDYSTWGPIIEAAGLKLE